MLTKSAVLKHYKRKDIQDAMIEHAVDREIGMCFGQGYGKRPDTLSYPRDVLELALKGVTSFHASEERWQNPLSISATLKRSQLAEMRSGWDLVLDIDCAIFEYSRICADLVIKFLQYNGVTAISCKFSGNKGFHIGVPFEAFPQTVGSEETRLLFPEAPRKIAAYVTHNITNQLAQRILHFENGSFEEVKNKVGLETQDIIRFEKDAMGNNVPKLHVDAFLEIDTILISSRHLYRMPYSLHEKSGLASVPVDPNKVMHFEKKMGEPSSLAKPTFKFLDRSVEESGRRLLTQALDFKVTIEPEREEPRKFEEIQITSPITQEFFPQCMKQILNGLEDGKKRALFCLMNYLGKIGWNKDDIKHFIIEWNKKNPEPLRETYINGQFYGFTPGAKLPPNCDNEGYYKALGIKCQGGHCTKVKNPVNFTLIHWRRRMREQEKKEKDTPKPKSES